ncbi:MAG: cytochrome d ubiquinol oxidase subunit II [Candidatus Omnitrophota bacterium]|jgi:cytochrome d ubiquinol oxidase subunit II
MNSIFDPHVIWFGLVGVLLTGYAILEGFDFGIGSLHLFAKGDEERRRLLNVIGPVWDANEVWLVAGGGALFAAFPEAYATVFSAFYPAFMLFLFALILRAAAIEFRSKLAMPRWRGLWDFVFSASSILACVLLGVAAGNLARGIPLDRQGEFTGSFISLLNPYSLLTGVTALSVFMLHGALYAAVKTEGLLHRRATTWVTRSLVFFCVCFAMTSVSTVLFVPNMTAPLRANPVLWLLPALAVYATGNIFRETRAGLYGRAFLSSAAVILLLMALFGAGLFPYLVYSRSAPQFSLTLMNASSSLTTLSTMLWVAAAGLPLVALYSCLMYRTFRGKVRLDSASY